MCQILAKPSFPYKIRGSYIVSIAQIKKQKNPEKPAHFLQNVEIISHEVRI